MDRVLRYIESFDSIFLKNGVTIKEPIFDLKRKSFI